MNVALGGFCHLTRTTRERQEDGEDFAGGGVAK